jgi:hypothetical protein
MAGRECQHQRREVQRVIELRRRDQPPDLVQIDQDRRDAFFELGSTRIGPRVSRDVAPRPVLVSPGIRDDRADMLDSIGDVAGLFQELPQRRRLGGLTWFEQPARELQRLPLDCWPKLAHQNQLLIGGNRDNAHIVAWPHDEIPLVLATPRHSTHDFGRDLEPLVVEQHLAANNFRASHILVGTSSLVGTPGFYR